MPVCGTRLLPYCHEPVLLLGLRVGHGDVVLRTELQNQASVGIAVAVPVLCLPRTSFYSSKSRRILALKSPKMRNLSFGSTCCRRLCRKSFLLEF